MSAEPTLLLDVAAAIADGRSVDFGALAKEQPAQAALLAKLALLANLDRPEVSTPPVRGGEGAEPSDDLKPFKWGHLHVLGLVGEGGFGQVYRAFDPILEREVALKLRKGEKRGSEARHFIDEARSLARVRHANVLAVYGADVHDGRIGLWSDLVRGETLEARLAAHGPLGSHAVLELAVPLADALAAVHAAELVHGDVKAANVMVEADGRVILMDFGAGSDLRDEEKRAARVRCGSPLSMAPELFAGKAASPAADVYALGALLFRLATGRNFVEARTVATLVGRLAGGEHTPFPTTRKPDSRAFFRLIAEMVRLEPEARPTALQVRERLLAILAAPATRRRRRVVVAIIASLAAGALAASIGFVRARSAERAANAARLETEAVNSFLTDVLASPRVNHDGPNVRVLDLLDRAAQTAVEQVGAAATVQARVFFVLGATELALQRQDRAQRLLERAIEAWRKSEPRSPLLGSQIEAELGLVYHQQERNEEALVLLDKAIADLDRIEPDGRFVVLARIYRARTRLDLGDLPGARRDLDAALALRSRPEQAADRDRRLARLDLANLEFVAGNYAEVERLTLEILPELLASHGERNDNSIWARQLLAGALNRLGRPAEAEPIARRNAEVAAEWIGHGSGFHIASLILLEDALWGMGQRDASLATYRDLIELSQHAEVDADTYVVIRSNYACRLLDLGRMAEAEPILVDLLATPSAIESLETSSFHIDGFNLAELYFKTGRAAQALALAREVHASMASQLGPDHLFTLVADALIGASTFATGQKEEGIRLLARVLERQRQLLGQEHPKTLETQLYLARARRESGETTLALSLLEDLTSRRRTSLGAEHPLTHEAEAELARWRG